MKSLTVLFPALIASCLVSCFLSCKGASTGSDTQPPPPVETVPALPGWTLVWNDEFSVKGVPSGAKWNYEIWSPYRVNNERQYYTFRYENARVDSGKLIVEARRETYDGKPNQYTSARLMTKGKAEWTYGRFEMRAKLPRGKGTWPALWLLAAQENYGTTFWPDNGEIDIMEHVGFDQGKIHSTIHTKSYNHIAGTQVGKSTVIDSADTAFHLYAVEWDADRILFFVDANRPFFTIERKATDTWKEWPFDKPFYLIFNIAIGGDWGGQQGIDDTIFPQRMEVDYVRVYKKSEGKF